MIHRSHRRSIKSSFRDKVHYKLRNTTIITHSSYSKFIRVTTPPGFDCRCWKKYFRLHSPAFDRGPEKKIFELNSPPRFRQYTRFPSKNRLIARRFSSHDRIIRLDLFGAEISFELNFVPQRVGIVNGGRRFDRGSKFLWVNGICHPCVDDDGSQSANKIMELLRKEIGMNVIRIFQSRHPYSRPCPTISGH